MSFSYIFDRIGKMDIGQKSLGSIGLVTSGIGLILEIFHCSEKRFNLIDSLMIWQMRLTMTIYSTPILRYFAEILSWPVEPSCLTERMAFRTSLNDTGVKMKPLLLSGRDSIFCMSQFSDFVFLAVVLKCSLISFGLALIFTRFGRNILWMVFQTSLGWFDGNALR